jgi:hypothetical protein
MEREKKYVVIKELDHNGQIQNVIMTDGLSQILEFDDKAKALDFAQLMEENSDSGWKYSVREI